MLGGRRFLIAAFSPSLRHGRHCSISIEQLLPVLLRDMVGFITKCHNELMAAIGAAALGYSCWAGHCPEVSMAREVITLLSGLL